MNFSLRCNSLKCRTQLNDEAVVTTCSHIFCTSCAETLGLSNPPHGDARICPACSTQLSNPDDAVIAQLNPSEDYKTSVLSGLSPSIIMECATRGLAFFSYQATQEIVYQEYLSKSLKDKYNTLSGQLDKVIHDANTEISGLREKLSAMHLERQELERRYQKLEQDFKQKNKATAQLQKHYDLLKQQQLLGNIEVYAENDASHVLGQQTKQAPTNHRAGIAPLPSRGSGGSGGREPNSWVQSFAGNRNGAGTATNRGNQQVPMTPSTHRMQLPRPGYVSHAGNYAHDSGIAGVDRRHTASTRPTLAEQNPNIFGGGQGGGSGMSAGVKVGRNPLSNISRAGYNGGGQGMGGGGMYR